MMSFKQKTMSICNNGKKNCICSCPDNSLPYCLKVNYSKFSGFILFLKTCENSPLITDRQQNHMQKHTLTASGAHLSLLSRLLSVSQIAERDVTLKQGNCI